MNLYLCFRKRIFPDTRQMGGFGSVPQRAAAANPATGGNVFGRHNWGRGHTLGGN